MSFRCTLLGTLALVGACSESAAPTAAVAPHDAAPSDVEASVDVIAVDVATRAPLPTVQGVPELVDHNPAPDVVEVDLAAGEAVAALVPTQMTTVMAYNGQTPGPLLHARVGDRVIVHFTNNLSEPTTVHWHGLRISSDMDGNPEVTPPVAPGETFTYDFVVPDAGTFWYHPHINTVQQLERGLYGAIVVHEAAAPRFEAERVFVVDDVRLGTDGQIAPFATSGHDLVHGRGGNVLLTNGSSARVTATAPRGAVERWRILNAAGSRTMTLSVEGASWRVIGTDGGLLPTPYSATQITVAAGQRYDLEVRFDAGDASSARLVSHVLTAVADGGVAVTPRTIAEVSFDGSITADPPVYPVVTLPDLATDPRAETIRLGATMTGVAGLQFTINGHAHDAPTLNVAQNVPVRFTIINEIAPEHPFHLHGQFFQIISRAGRDAAEPGLKDTVLLGAMERVVIETRFENPGRWMYHCHIPEHAELGMMAEVDVTPAP